MSCEISQGPKITKQPNNGGVDRIKHVNQVVEFNNALSLSLKSRFEVNGLKIGVLTENNIPKVLTEEQIRKAEELRSGRNKFVRAVNSVSDVDLGDIVGLYKNIDKGTRAQEPRKRIKKRLGQFDSINYITNVSNLTKMPEAQMSVLIPGNEPAKELLNEGGTNFEEVFVATTRKVLEENEGLVEGAGKLIPLRKEVGRFVEAIENIGDSITVIGDNKPLSLTKKIIGQAGDYSKIHNHGLLPDDVTVMETDAVIKKVVSNDISNNRASVFIGAGEKDIEIVNNQGEIFSSILALNKSKLERALTKDDVLHGVVKKSDVPEKQFQMEWKGEDILTKRFRARQVAPKNS